MSTRREFLKQAAAAGVVVATSVQVAQAAVAGMSICAPAVWAARKSPRIRSVIRREETVIRYSGDGDCYHMSWAADDRQYVSVCDGMGFSNRPNVSYNSRLFAIEGGPRDAKFHDLPGYPMLGKPIQGPKDPRYYNFGTLALDGSLYQFLSTFNRPLRPEDFESSDGSARFNGVKLIYSPDNGRTWHNQNGSTPVVWESWNQRSKETMVFWEEDQDAFSLLSMLQMGKNYEHNRDGYIYVYAPNGNTEGAMNELVLFRVSRGKLLDRSAYEYFAGLQFNSGAKWSKDIFARKPVHTFPRGWVNRLIHPYAWQPSVVYDAPLGLYLMANWGMGTAADGTWFAKPSYLGFWVARNPWGPWRQIHEETTWMPAGDPKARAFQPQIAPKWIAPDGKSFWLVWTDYQGEKDLMGSLAEYQRNPDSSSDAVTSLVTMRRKHMPYYSFNVQRVDLAVS